MFTGRLVRSSMPLRQLFMMPMRMVSSVAPAVSDIAYNTYMDYVIVHFHGNILAVRAAQPTLRWGVLLLRWAVLPRHSFALIQYFGLFGLDFFVHSKHLLVKSS